MAYSIVGQPDQFVPASNPIFYYGDSTAKNDPGFKYIVDVYSASTSDRLTRYKLHPRPTDGYCVADINQILATQVSTHFNPSNNLFSTCPDNYCKYDIHFGEEKIFYWPFTSAASGPLNILVLSSTTTSASPFETGTTFYGTISGTNMSYIDGTFLCAASTADPNVVGVYTPYSGVLSSITGTVCFSDRRKSVVNDLVVISGRTAYAGAMSHKDFRTFSSTTYHISPIHRGKFLTNVPNNYHLKQNNKMWLNLYSTATTDFAKSLVVTTDYGAYKFTNTTTGSNTMLTFGAGPGNISGLTPNTIISGTTGIFKDKSWTFYDNFFSTSGCGLTSITEVHSYTVGDIVLVRQSGGYQNASYEGLHSIVAVPDSYSIILDVPFASSSPVNGGIASQKTTSYSIYLVDTGNTRTSEIKTFDIDDRCSSFEPFELLFLDKQGSYIPANFDLQSTKTINIEKSYFKGHYGDYDPSLGRWSYDSTDGAKRTLTSLSAMEIQLTSQFLEESEIYFWRELFASPVVYLKEDGQYWPVIVKTSSFQPLKKKNKKNILATITIEYANQDRSQVIF